ncbi:hypothetical protein JHK87_050107 [Glycine soja]|nr:hypothetical protein JHK87_050107 [Glycine soja]
MPWFLRDFGCVLSNGIFHSGHTGQVRASGTSAAFGTCMHCMALASARASHRSSAASGSEGLEVVAHVRKLSNESVGSNGSSIRGSDMSNFGIPNSSGYSSHDLPGSAMVSRETTIMGHTKLKSTGDTQLVLPLDQRNKLNRSLSTMQRRLGTAKTDMEDLIVRLNQEIAAKDFLATKVKDLEVELETTKLKNKENLQQAILIVRERFTQMQWDMEELRRQSLEMQNDVLLENLDATKEQLEILLKQYGELEAKSKADVKVLVKEVGYNL